MDNNLIQSQIHESCKLCLPEGLKELMSDISREVLRVQPQNVYQFIANYLESLLEVRDVLSIAYHICNDTSECACEPELHNELEAIGLDEDDLNKAMEIIGEHLKNESVNEPSLITKLITKTSIDESHITTIQDVVQRAFKRQQLKNTKAKFTQNKANDTTINAVQHTLRLYQRSMPSSNKHILAPTAFTSCTELKSDMSGNFDNASQEQDQYLELPASNNLYKDLTNLNDTKNEDSVSNNENNLVNEHDYDLLYPKYDDEDFNEDVEEVFEEKSDKNSVVSSVIESLTNDDNSNNEVM